MSWNFPTAASLALFAATYALISMRRIPGGRLDRASVTLLGAVAMVAVGALSLEDAYRCVSHDTIALLAGMMALIGFLRLAGFFEWMAGAVLRVARTPRRLLWLLVFASGTLSALFVNDTICLLFTPIVLAAVLRAGLDPVPYLLALATSSNIGSVMTLTGNPQNMLVGIYSGIPWGRFFLLLAPIAVVCLAVDAAFLSWLYRRRLPAAFEALPFDPPPVDRRAIRRLLPAFALVLAGFLLPLHRWLRLEPGQNLPFAALAGAGLAFLLARRPAREAIAAIDWPLLLFFSALFVVVEGVRATGVLPALHARMEPFFGASAPAQAATMTGFSIGMSNLVSNVPFVAVARHWVEGFREPDLIWYVIAMSSTFAGNLTIVGSVANMIVLEGSREKAPIGFFEYVRAGAPLAIVTSGIGLLLLLGFRSLGWI